MLLHECPRTKQSGLLSLVNQQEHRVRRPGPRQQGSGNLDHNPHPAAIVANAGPAGTES